MNPLARTSAAADPPALLRPRRRRASAPPRWRRCSSERAARGDGRRRPAGPAALRAEGEARHLPVPVRRRRRSSTCSTTSRSSQKLRGKELPDSIRKGQRLTGMTARPGAASRSRRRCSSSRSTASAARGSASCCRTRRRSSTSCASSSRCTPRRSTTTRPSPSSRPAPSSPAGRASAPGSATAWAARTEDLPAFVVHDLAGHRQARRPAALRPAVGQRLPADAAIRASSSAPAATRCCTCPNPPGVDRDDAPRACSTTWRELNQLKLERGRRPGDRHAHRPVRDGVPHADRRCRS